jgi:transcriptional regulator with XRE-family HTH domain
MALPSAGVSRASRQRDPRYFVRRNLMMLRGQWRPFTDAAPARARVRALMAAGVSRQQISGMSGVTDSVLSRLLYGEPSRGKPPTRGLRPRDAARLLAVTAAPGLLAGAALADATGTRRRLQALTARGWPLRELAARLGANTGGLRRTRDGARTRVTADTARKVSALYEELWDQAPPQRTAAERIAASKARARACRHDWAPPLAWDDDTISDPAAGPAGCWRPSGRTTRRGADLAEDASELAAQGYSREQAAARLGVTRGALDRAIERSRIRASGRTARVHAGAVVPPAAAHAGVPERVPGRAA